MDNSSQVVPKSCDVPCVSICVSLGGLLHQSFVVGEDSYRSNGYISNFRLNAGDPAGLNSLTLRISHQFAILFCCWWCLAKLGKNTSSAPPTPPATSARPTYYCNKSFKCLAYRQRCLFVDTSFEKGDAIIETNRWFPAQKVSHFQDAHIIS